MISFETAYLSLTPKEREVYHLVCTGTRQAVIAQLMQIKIKTIKYHCTNIYKKFQVRNRNQLITASIAPLYEENQARTIEEKKLVSGKPKREAP